MSMKPGKYTEHHKPHAPFQNPAGLLGIWMSRFRILIQLIPRITSINGGIVPALCKTLQVFHREGTGGVRSYIRRVAQYDDVSRYESPIYQTPHPLPDNPTTVCHLRAAVHIHVDDPEAVEGLASYLSRIPFEYDLYLSMSEDVYGACASQRLSGVPNTRSCRTAVIPGDACIAPLFITFGKEIMGHDLICHVHTGSPSRMGGKGESSRGLSLQELTMSGELSAHAIDLFARHREIGLVYQKPHPGAPYWRHTWLSHEGTVRQLLNSMGITGSFPHYIDLPEGFVFWARVRAVEPLLKAGPFCADCDGARGRLGSDLDQALLRTLIPVLKSRGMTFAEIDGETRTYRLNSGSKNLRQYWNMNAERLREAIDSHETVSFDIFDTLVTRPLLSPDTAFSIAEIKVKKALNSPVSFAKFRKQAEIQSRRKKRLAGDCSIDDIYTEFRNITGLSEAACESIRQTEIENEISLCVPRSDMVEAFLHARSMNKRVFLISDMYLRRLDVERLLSKCGIYGYDELMLSCETGRRKDTGELWDCLKAREEGSRWLHIGDNEHSDVSLPMEKGFEAFHVMSGTNVFSHTAFGKRLLQRFGTTMQPGDSAILGTLVAHIFNSPFALHSSDGDYRIRDPRSMGYAVFGPIFTAFLTWLIRSTREDGRDILLFLSREGFFLEKLYHRMLECFKQQGIDVKRIETRYFLASRRAASLASLMTEPDILELLEAPYQGTMSYLADSRFGLSGGTIPCPDELVSLPGDLGRVRKAILSCTDQILHRAKAEREGYLQYCSEIGLPSRRGIGIIDLGYSGSIQYYLSRIFQRPTAGYYLVTSDTLRGLRYEGNTMKGCFSYKDHDTGMVSPMYTYALILEGILTSPDGQFMGFGREHDSLKPVFDAPGKSQKVFDSLSLIFEGVSDFIGDTVRVHGSCLLDLPVSEGIPQFILKHLALDKDFLSDEVKALFFVDDKYGSDRDISIFDFYRKIYSMGE